MDIKYVGADALKNFINKCKSTFALIGHSHTYSEVGADEAGSAAAALGLANQHTDEQISKVVQKSGDTMTGYLNWEKTVNDVPYKAIVGVAGNGNTYIQHYTNGTRDNYITLSGTSSFAEKPWHISSGGTGASTAAEALKNFGLTATVKELNTLDGITVDVTELNYMDGTTSNVQEQLNQRLTFSDAGTVGQFATSDGSGGVTWLTVKNGNEVAY